MSGEQTTTGNAELDQIEPPTAHPKTAATTSSSNKSAVEKNTQLSSAIKTSYIQWGATSMENLESMMNHSHFQICHAWSKVFQMQHKSLVGLIIHFAQILMGEHMLGDQGCMGNLRIHKKLTTTHQSELIKSTKKQFKSQQETDTRSSSLNQERYSPVETTRVDSQALTLTLIVHSLQ